MGRDRRCSKPGNKLPGYFLAPPGTADESLRF